MTPRKRRRGSTQGGVLRVIKWGAIVGGVAFGLWGGEYSTWDWWTLKRQVASEQRAVVQLEREIDSLTPIAEGLEKDPAIQEQVAREKFGMVRAGEILYQVEVVR